MVGIVEGTTEAIQLLCCAQTSIFRTGMLVPQIDKETFVPFVGRLVMGCKPEVVVTAILCLKHSWRVDKPIFYREIEPVFLVLRMCKVNQLLTLATQKISQLSERTGGLVELGILYRIRIGIILMKTSIPAGFHYWIEKQRSCCSAEVAQVICGV